MKGGELVVSGREVEVAEGRVVGGLAAGKRAKLLSRRNKS